MLQDQIEFEIQVYIDDWSDYIYQFISNDVPIWPYKSYTSDVFCNWIHINPCNNDFIKPLCE